MKVEKSVDHFVPIDYILLPRRLCIWLPGSRFKGEDILLEKDLLDDLLQVSSEGPVMDGLVLLAVVVGVVLLRSGQREIGLDRLRASDP